MQVLLGKKIGMSSYFTADGVKIPITVVHAGPCTVVQVKTLEKDKYQAVQLGYLDKKESRVNKPAAGHFKKAGVTPKKVVKEFRVDDVTGIEVGATVDCSFIKQGDQLMVSGKSKGKGFQGVIKRWGYKRQGRTHGTHESKRGPGSIGQCASPAKVWKGKPMPGRMGGEQKTIKNLEVVKVLEDKNILFIKGSIPGARNGIIQIRKMEV